MSFITVVALLQQTLPTRKSVSVIIFFQILSCRKHCLRQRSELIAKLYVLIAHDRVFFLFSLSRGNYSFMPEETSAAVTVDSCRLCSDAVDEHCQFLTYVLTLSLTLTLPTLHRHTRKHPPFPGAPFPCPYNFHGFWCVVATTTAAPPKGRGGVSVPSPLRLFCRRCVPSSGGLLSLRLLQWT